MYSAFSTVVGNTVTKTVSTAETAVKKTRQQEDGPPSFESPNITFLFTQLSGLGENAQHVGMAVHPASRVPA